MGLTERLLGITLPRLVVKVRLKTKRILFRLLGRFPRLQSRLGRLRLMLMYRFGLRRRRAILVEALQRDGRLQAAYEALQPAVHSIDVRMRAGKLRLDAGDVTSAMDWFRGLLDLVDYHPDRVIPIGHALAVAGYLDQSVEVYAEAVRRCGKRGQSRVRLAGQEVQVLPYYWVDRIGHLAFLDALIKMMIMGWIPPRMLILLAPREKIANLTYLDYWRPFLLVESDPQTIAALEPLVHILEDQYFAAYVAPAGTSCWWIKAAWAAELQWDREQRNPLLQLTKRDECDLKLVLEQMGIGADDWFVCLHVRESGYHALKNDPVQTWRDSDIERFDEAIDAVVQRGGWVVRMGDPGMKPLRPRERVIDYALSPFKSEWMDIVLCARCRFFIATNSGLGIVPATFGVPAISVDYLPLANELFIKNGCFLPKLCWLPIENRYLSFDECMRTPFGHTHSGNSFAGVELHQNSPGEIREIVVEMMDRLDGLLSPDEAAASLQARFDVIRLRHGVVSNSPVGRDFLKRHADLLGPATKSVPAISERNALVESFGLPLNTVSNNIERGKVFLAGGAFGMAVACFEESLKLQPDDSMAAQLLREANFKREQAAMIRGPGEGRRHAVSSVFKGEEELLPIVDKPLLVTAEQMQSLQATMMEIQQLKAALAEFDDPDPPLPEPYGSLVSAQSIRTKMIDGLVEGWGPMAYRVTSQLRARFPDIDDDGFWKIADRALPRTALSVQRLYSIYLSVKYVVESGVPGDVVECGVFKGGSAIMMAASFAYFGDVSRRIFLFDTFEGWPQPTDPDVDFFGQDHKHLYDQSLSKAREHEQENVQSIFTLPEFFESTRAAILSGSDYPQDKFFFIKGLVESTLPNEEIKALSILRLDTDYYESTAWELKTLWPTLSVGGVLLIDDYGQFHGARKAVDEYLHQNRIPALLHRDDVTGRTMVKLRV